MPKVESRDVWKAKAKLRLNRVAFSLQYKEVGHGTAKRRIVIPTGWLGQDGKTIRFDVGKRLKGWLKEQMTTVKPSLVPRVQYGVVCRSLPKVGMVQVATIDDVAPSRTWASFKDAENYDLDGKPEPEAEFLISKDGRSVSALYYVLGKPIEVEVEIQSFANGVRSEAVENWLRTLGSMKGLGDKHNVSEAFGTFEVLSYEVTERKELKF